MPVVNPHNTAEEQYSKAHKHSMSVVEQTFGMLKTRVRCPDRFGGSLLFSPESRINIINDRLGVTQHLLEVANFSAR